MLPATGYDKAQTEKCARGLAMALSRLDRRATWNSKAVAPI